MPPHRLCAQQKFCKPLHKSACGTVFDQASKILDTAPYQDYSCAQCNFLGLQQGLGGVVAFGKRASSVQTITADREFESLLQRTSAIFKERDSRLLKFPGKSEQKRLGNLRTRKAHAQQFLRASV
jgi:hypothetical protein